MYLNAGCYFSDIHWHHDFLPLCTTNPKARLIEIPDISPFNIISLNSSTIAFKPTLDLLNLGRCNSNRCDWFSRNRMKAGLVIPRPEPRVTRRLLLYIGKMICL